MEWDLIRLKYAVDRAKGVVSHVHLTHFGLSDKMQHTSAFYQIAQFAVLLSFWKIFRNGQSSSSDHAVLAVTLALCTESKA